MTRPRLLDLFCGAGGAAMGYHRAGFDVTGVDIAPQPRYPFEFVQADALEFPLDGYDAVHASPPCQAYSTISADREYADLYEAVRDRLVATGTPWVIENVPNAPYRSGIVLCGGMFGMSIRRHRNFETSHLILTTPHVCPPKPWMVTGDLHRTAQVFPRHRKPDRGTAVAIMGTPWMTHVETVQAVPPAYTEHIGAQLLAYVTAAA